MFAFTALIVKITLKLMLSTGAFALANCSATYQDRASNFGDPDVALLQYEEKNIPGYADVSPYWSGYAPLQSGHDLYYCGILGGSFDPKKEAEVKSFLDSIRQEYTIARPQGDILQDYEQFGFTHKIAFIQLASDVFEQQYIIDVMRDSKLFLEVAPLHDTEAGNGIGWADIMKAGKLFSNPNKPSAAEGERNLDLFLRDFVRQFGEKASVDHVSSERFTYLFNLMSLRNAVLKGMDNWENVNLSLSVSKPLDRDGLVIHIYFEVKVAPGTSRNPQPLKFEDVQGEERNMKRFATLLAKSMEEYF